VGSVVPNGGFDSVLLCSAPDAASLFHVVDVLGPEIASPGVVHLAGAVRSVLPGAATQGGVPEFTVALVHFQNDVLVLANEVLKGHHASATAGETVAVGNVTVVGKLAGAVAVGAGAGFGGGGHGPEGGGHRCPQRN